MALQWLADVLPAQSLALRLASKGTATADVEDNATRCF